MKVTRELRTDIPTRHIFDFDRTDKADSIAPSSDQSSALVTCRAVLRNASIRISVSRSNANAKGNDRCQRAVSIKQVTSGLSKKSKGPQKPNIKRLEVENATVDETRAIQTITKKAKRKITKAKREKKNECARKKKAKGKCSESPTPWKTNKGTILITLPIPRPNLS